MKTKKFAAHPVHWAIDPGSTESGWVQFQLDPTHPSGIGVLSFGKMENRNLRSKLRKWLAEGDTAGCMAIEMVQAQGMREKNEIFETCVQIGRILQTWVAGDWSYVFRKAVKLHLCGTTVKINDSDIRRVLLDLWGGETKALGGKRCKRCHGHAVTGKQKQPCQLCDATGYAIKPGPLHGMSKDMYAALAVAVTWAATQEKKHDLTPSLAKQTSACGRCKVKACEFRGDKYNIGKIPGVDCLATEATTSEMATCEGK